VRQRQKNRTERDTQEGTDRDKKAKAEGLWLKSCFRHTCIYIYIYIYIHVYILHLLHGLREVGGNEDVLEAEFWRRRMHVRHHRVFSLPAKSTERLFFGKQN